MAAVAGKSSNWNGNLSERKSRSFYRVKKARSRALHTTFTVIGCVTLLLAFAYVALYANTLVQERKYADLVQKQRELKIKNDRLRLRLNALSAPDKIMAAAAKAGMVYAKQYDYLGVKNCMAKRSDIGEIDD